MIHPTTPATRIRPRTPATHTILNRGERGIAGRSYPQPPVLSAPASTDPPRLFSFVAQAVTTPRLLLEASVDAKRKPATAVHAWPTLPQFPDCGSLRLFRPVLVLAVPALIRGAAQMRGVG
jgi:hypothetical protein